MSTQLSQIAKKAKLDRKAPHGYRHQDSSLPTH